MAFDTKKNLLKPVRQRKYLNKSFDALRADLLEYAKTYYGDRIKDFSDASLGGVFLDFAGFSGDVLAFYLDHQFSELDPTLMVETRNIQRALKNAGVQVVGASPAVVDATFFVEIPAVTINGVLQPRPDALPVIQQNTICLASNGTQFNLTNTLDFTQLKPDGTFLAQTALGRTTATGAPLSYIMSLHGICISGFYTRENFSIGNSFVPFRTITLSNPNVTDVVNCSDTLGNTYYLVDDMSQDVVYLAVSNLSPLDNQLVQDNLEIVPAPYRFVRAADLGTRLTTLTFGGGSAATIDNDVVPDPSEFAIPLYGKRSFPITSLNPATLLQTDTLGVAAVNTTLSVDYRWGGGLSHNIPAGSLNDVQTLIMTFPGNPGANVAQAVRSSVQITNNFRAAGGEDAPTADELKLQIPASRNAQSRIVSKEDLLARVYTMPSNFGRVFRAAVQSNPNNPLATQLFVISRDSNSRLITSPDALKNNLKTYLNQFRMISDAIDILDAAVVNLTLAFQITTDPTANKSLIVQNVLKALKQYFAITNFQIEQPLVLSDMITLIYSVPGVVSIPSNNNQMLSFTNINGIVANRQYSNVIFDVITSTTKGLLIPPPGGIFEVRFPDVDMVCTAV